MQLIEGSNNWKWTFTGQTWRPGRSKRTFLDGDRRSFVRHLAHWSTDKAHQNGVVWLELRAPWPCSADYWFLERWRTEHDVVVGRSTLDWNHRRRQEWSDWYHLSRFTANYTPQWRTGQYILQRWFWARNANNKICLRCNCQVFWAILGLPRHRWSHWNTAKHWRYTKGSRSWARQETPRLNQICREKRWSDQTMGYSYQNASMAYPKEAKHCTED